MTQMLVGGDLSGLNINLGGGPASRDYTQLYNCKHFRNRVLRLQALIQELQLDSILIIQGMDAKRDEEMTKLANWLMFGLSSSDIHGVSPDFYYEDSFFVISKSSMQIYTSHIGYNALHSLVALVPNCNIFALSVAEEQDTELAETLKVTKFYEMVHDKQTVGVPVSPITAGDARYSDWRQKIESWPLIQAYGLDIVGNGFFGMKHKVVSIIDSLEKIYQELDSFAMFRLVFDQIERLNRACYNNFIRYNRASAYERQSFTELKMVEEFRTRHNFSILFNKSASCTIIDDELPQTRALVGPERTNLDFAENSDPHTPLIELNDKRSALHATIEHTEKNSGMRFARTVFLSTLASADTKYMDGVYFSEDADLQAPSDEGMLNQHNSLTLFNLYQVLVRTFDVVSDRYLTGSFSQSDLVGMKSFQAFDEELAKQGKVDRFKVFPQGVSQHLTVHVKSFNSYGSCQKKGAVDPKNLIVVRMQLKNIQSEHSVGQNLGSLIYAQSFFIIEPSTWVCLTKSVPNSLLWLTDHMHYRNVPMPLEVDKPVNCQQLGKQLETSDEVVGFYPVQPEFHDTLQDRILTGKLTFFEKGIVFSDMRLGAFVLPYTAIEKFTFYAKTMTTKDWMEVTLNEEGKNLVPCGYLNESSFYLLVRHSFANETITKINKITDDLEMVQVKARNQRIKERLEKQNQKAKPAQPAPQAQAQEEDNSDDEESKDAESTAAETTANETATEAAPSEAPSEAEQSEVAAEEPFDDQLAPIMMPKIEKSQDEVARIVESFAWKNYLKNDADYKSTFGSEQEHFSWNKSYFTELLEFHAIQEFNELKGKQFVPLNQFSEVYRLVQNKPAATSLENTLAQLTSQLKRNPEDPTSLISIVLVAGIPGSGKGRFANAMKKNLGNEKLKAFNFKMPTVQKSLKYDTTEFVTELDQFAEGLRAQNKNVDVIVAAMPSYHHLKKAIMELRKSDIFVRRFEIKYVVTKVRAHNFYMTPHSNMFQFLVENCMKGIAHAIVFEKGFVDQKKIVKMLNILEQANPGAILPVTGTAFDLEELSQIMMRQNDRLNKLYTKHFYGFEKEGKADCYLEKQVSAAVIPFKYPLKLSELHAKLHACVTRPMTDVEFLIPRSEEEIKQEEKEAALLAEKVAKMDDLDRRRYDREQKRKARIEEDLIPERRMQAAMDEQKKILQTAVVAPDGDSKVAMMYERIRGIVKNEEDDTQDYELVITADEINFRGLKNTNARIPDEDRVLLIYGRNLNQSGLETLRDLLKLCHTQVEARRILKKRIDITTAEEEAIQEEFFNQFMPTGWYFDGSLYRTRDGGSSSSKHPNLEMLLQRHLDGINDDIGEFNRNVRKQVQEEEKQFE